MSSKILEELPLNSSKYHEYKSIMSKYVELYRKHVLFTKELYSDRAFIMENTDEFSENAKPFIMLKNNPDKSIQILIIIIDQIFF